MNTKKQERRKKALIRLEKQLSSGVKPDKIKDKVTGKMKTMSNIFIKLEDKDIKRINTQIETLKLRI